jgi:hypothetical protein
MLPCVIPGMVVNCTLLWDAGCFFGMSHSCGFQNIAWGNLISQICG